MLFLFPGNVSSSKWLNTFSQLYWRDGDICPFTGLRFAAPGRHVVPQSAHILPFSFHNKVCDLFDIAFHPHFIIKQHLTLSALETFIGRPIAEEVKNNINHPCNAFNVETNAHDTFDKLAWGIEAMSSGTEVNNFMT